MNRPRGVDPEWLWLQNSLCRLYLEADGDATIVGVGINVLTAEGLLIQYTLDPGNEEIRRTIVTPEAMALSHEFAAAAIDITPDP